MPYIAATLSCDQNYTVWEKPISEGGKIARPAKAQRQIFINGRANVQNKIQTPQGVITHVTDEEVELLKSNAVFQIHEKNGSVKILAREIAPEKFVKDMRDRDESAPLNESKGDFKKGGRAAGVAPKNSKIE